MKIKRSPIESPLIRSYRELLGVGPGGTIDEIKKAYRRLVQIYHPDKNSDPGGQAQFLKVTEAYDVLTDSSRIQTLNKTYLDQRLYDFPIEGIKISFGSFFGYRSFSLNRVARERRLGLEKAGEKDVELGYFDFSNDDSQSILDNPAYDSIELIYAGKFSLNDEEQVQVGFQGQHLGQLPWVILNNKGIIEFLDERFESSLECYLELNERIPNNIIFLYRLGLCHAILAFKNKTKKFLGKEEPNKEMVNLAVDCFRRAIALGETRSIGKQKCITIRKTLADLFEKIGQKKLAKRIWKEIFLINPESPEAAFKLGYKIKSLPKKN